VNYSEKKKKKSVIISETAATGTIRLEEENKWRSV
jgi:hypothetical protein